MNLQHVNVKFPLANQSGVNLEPLVPVFHSWIRNKVCEELMLDIADYRHVPEGPGIILIGHQADYSVDNTENILGVRYNRKTLLDGSNQDRLQQAARAALNAAQLLASEATLGGKFGIGGQAVQIFFNDRLLATNNESTKSAAAPELDAFLKKLFRGADVSLTYETEPRRLFGVTARSSKSFSPAELIANLG